MIRQKVCPRGCGLLLDISPGNGRLYGPGDVGPHWCARRESAADDLLECQCGRVVWRAADGTKTDATTGNAHVCHTRRLAEPVVVEEPDRGGATPGAPQGTGSLGTPPPPRSDAPRDGARAPRGDAPRRHIRPVDIGA